MAGRSRTTDRDLSSVRKALKRPHLEYFKEFYADTASFGSRKAIEHAIEFFGGTVDIKHAVASNAADDSFDWTFGWRGRAQFVAIHQRSDDADWGIEADSNEFNDTLLPRSNPQLYNFTICGDPDRNEGIESVRAVLLRRGTAVTFSSDSLGQM